MRTFVKIGLFTLVVNPITTALYVDTLGRMSGLHALGESGSVKNMKTSKSLIGEAHKQISFVRDVGESGLLIWAFIFFGPFSIPYSLCFIIKSTFDCATYNIYHRHKVEQGIYDRPM